MFPVLPSRWSTAASAFVCMRNHAVTHHRRPDSFCQEKKEWSFLSFVLPGLIPEAETELEVRGFYLRGHLDARFFTEEEIVESVGNGIVDFLF